MQPLHQKTDQGQFLWLLQSYKVIATDHELIFMPSAMKRGRRAPIV
jgi:hypothetical protein